MSRKKENFAITSKSHKPPLCKGRWHTNVWRRGCQLFNASQTPHLFTLTSYLLLSQADRRGRRSLQFCGRTKFAPTHATLPPPRRGRKHTQLQKILRHSLWYAIINTTTYRRWRRGNTAVIFPFWDYDMYSDNNAVNKNQTKTALQCRRDISVVWSSFASNYYTFTFLSQW